MEYLRPTVRALKPTDDIWYYLWMKSRRKVIKSVEGKDDDWETIFSDPSNQFPDEFIVGTEQVDNKSYKERIKKLNLQFTNFSDSILEIQGSCLFRDLLFNINKVAQWAESNRFLFSILPGDAIYDENNYPVSKEYQDIDEWDDAFDRYMDEIKKDPITDHNRLYMPYSISSKFWVKISLKTAIAFVSMLKLQMPFFYDVYGRLIMNAMNFTEDDLVSYVDIALQQYYSPKNWIEDHVQKVNDIVHVNLTQGLLLYSQFLRQSDCTITGLYSELIHTSPDKFVHKVFIGSTPLKVSYTAHESRVLRTITNRCCNFAQSSGDGICSWSRFINLFLSELVQTTDDFRNLLPCKFENKKVVDCKFMDDVKFRKEGIESRNTICPLLTGDLKLAELKCERDKNKLSEWYLRLTQEMQNE